MLYKWIILPHQTSIFRSLKREQYFSGALGKMNINIPTCTFIHTLKLSSKLQSIKCLLSRKTNLSARVLNCIFSRFVRNIMKNISLAQSVSTFSIGSHSTASKPAIEFPFFEINSSLTPLPPPSLLQKFLSCLPCCLHFLTSPSLLKARQSGFYSYMYGKLLLSRLSMTNVAKYSDNFSVLFYVTFCSIHTLTTLLETLL